MQTKLDLIAVVGEYTDAQGNNKKRFAKGLKIDNVPLNWDGWLSAKAPLEPKAAPRQAAPMPDDDIPF
jgi:hypothetical protein